MKLDVTETIRFKLRWWVGWNETMNWFSFGPMRTDNARDGSIVGVCVNFKGHFFGVSRKDWWS